MSKLKAALLTLCLALSAFAADATGKWDATAKTPDGQDMELAFDLKLDGEKISGTVTSQVGEIPITEGKLTGDDMKLKVDLSDQSMEITAKRAKS